MVREIGKGGLAISSKMKANARGCAVEVLQRFEKVTQIWTYATFPDHNNGRCVDYMVYNDRATGDAIADYHVRNWRRMGVEVIIWHGRIWRSYNKLSGTSSPSRAYQWAPYRGPKNHNDHPHVQYNGLSYEAPVDTGKAATPAVVSTPPAAKPAPTEEDEIMALTKETLKAIGEAVGNADVVPNLGQTDNAANKFLTIKNALLENFRESRDARLQAGKATEEAAKATAEVSATRLEVAATRQDLAALKEQLDRIEQALPKA